MFQSIFGGSESYILTALRPHVGRGCSLAEQTTSANLCSTNLCSNSTFVAMSHPQPHGWRRWHSILERSVEIE